MARTKVNPHVANNLRALRLEHGLSLRQVAEVIGSSYQQIAKYEKGLDKLPSQRMYRLSQLYDVPMESFFEAVAKEKVEGLYQNGSKLRSAMGRLREMSEDKQKLVLNFIALLDKYDIQETSDNGQE